ncbi:MAG: hypothetical protein ACFE9Q_13785 [Candidatus Hodarchaeota archaeon]
MDVNFSFPSKIGDVGNINILSVLQTGDIMLSLIVVINTTSSFMKF